ncbi:hypothetical protein HG536_0A00480 [Torulaspora globosa]|uniref:Transcription initiation factor TFIID subunit 1 histone acetyltransferase domain-containing protein n=1 Tax=Torulaspora globosa TaxID=48254 RepID=A0A7G3Z9P5_9SACH|nr:uncharacterized protein HG536_0A00480 [Torulaspora globosa]QLL30231.1 hypothetical protein HG536_0A00480 [Torulaspora globosa]
MPAGEKGRKNRPADLSNEDDAYEAIFGGEFGSLEIGGYIGRDDESETKHLSDAIDFEDEDELADEELPDEEMREDESEAARRLEGGAGHMGGHVGDFMGHEGSGGDYDGGNNALFMGMDGNNGVLMERNHSFAVYRVPPNQEEQRKAYQQQQLLKEAERKTREDKLLLKSYFPNFKKGKVLKWNSLLYKRPGKYHWAAEYSPARKNLEPLMPLNLRLQVQPDGKKLFNTKESTWTSSSLPSLASMQNKRHSHGIIVVTLDELDPEEVHEHEENRHTRKISEELLIATDDWDQERIINEGAVSSKNQSDFARNSLKEDEKDWDWNEDDLVDAKLDNNQARLDMNDEQLLLIKGSGYRKSEEHVADLLPLNEKGIMQKFNNSNDDEYNVLGRNHQTKVRATISNLNIDHSQPAIRLQSPYYKVNMPKKELRYFHRPNFGKSIRPGTNIVFSKLKVRKRKRDKGKEVKESFASTQDLTIGDTAPVFLMEYSEQNPIALSKFGMANKLINYYRKMNEQDASRPKLPVGETYVLGIQDKSPFWNFGFVEPGHIVPTLYNNMIRAPVFKHDVSGTDFLLVRSSGNGVSNRFYLRSINHLFVVGQTFPVEEIPGPNSRRVTSMRTTRLRMVVYRILNRTPSQAISIEPIARHFPDQDYGQNRQKIKEFMKYQREGADKGLWKLKEGEPLLDNESAKKLITPEQVSEVESMNQGLQFQEDNEFFNFDEKLLKLEENLLPWNAAKNFVNATQMRAMIQIHGAGDPTGCGEGFSFLKTSMKGGFLKSGMDNGKSQSSSGHSYNVAEQQKAYEEEISKTWYTHAKSLSIINPFEEMDDPDEVNSTNRHVLTSRTDGKVLRIVRKKRDENGIIQRQTLVVRDPRVIKGYLKSKEKRREANLNVEKLLEEETTVQNVEDIEMQKKLLQSELASLEKSQQRRAARQVSKTKSQDNKVTKTKNTTRRCARCGQVGHIRTKKSCPMYDGSLGTSQGSGVGESGAANLSAAEAPAASPITN